MRFYVYVDMLLDPFPISILINESTITERVYINCHLSLSHRLTYVDLVELDIFDFDVILGIDLVNYCYSYIDCRTRVIMFQFPKEPIL